MAMVHAAVAPGWSRKELCRRAAELEKRLRESPEAAKALLSARRKSDSAADDLERMTRCRSAALDGSWESREPSPPAEAWHVAWARESPEYGVVYGHWALQGLHQSPDLRGLDTGCVYHGNGRDGFLTAWVPDPAARDPFALLDAGIWRVRAKRRYWSP